MYSHLSIRDRWRIISLRSDQGMASDEIASRINCSIRTVYYILQLFRETNDVIEREGRGRRLLNETGFLINEREFDKPINTFHLSH
ncbi:unnamed protein product, partial [Rotaria sp. Silwood2]